MAIKSDGDRAANSYRCGTLVRLLVRQIANLPEQILTHVARPKGEPHGRAESTSPGAKAVSNQA